MTTDTATPTRAEYHTLRRGAEGAALKAAVALAEGHLTEARLHLAEAESLRADAEESRQ